MHRPQSKRREPFVTVLEEVQGLEGLVDWPQNSSQALSHSSSIYQHQKPGHLRQHQPRDTRNQGQTQPAVQHCCDLHNNIVWANNYPTGLDKVLTIQKILRIITFSSHDSTSLTLFKKFGKEVWYLNKNDLLTGSFSFSFNKNTLTPYSKGFCTLNFNNFYYYTRSSRNLHKAFNRTNYSIYSTYNTMIDIWNS